MMRKPILCAFTLILLSVDSSNAQADEKPLNVAAWISTYQKLGGKVAYNSEHPEILGIIKLAKQLNLVSLNEIKPLVGIKKIVLQGYEVDDSDLEALVGWNDLEKVEVLDGKKITDKGVTAIARMPKLREAVFADTCTGDTGIKSFSGHRTLTQLTVINTNIRTQIKALDLQNLPQLEKLTLACEGIKTITLAKMPKLQTVADFPGKLNSLTVTKLNALTELDLRGTGLKTLLLRDLPTLKTLDLRQTNVDANVIDELRRTYPRLELTK